MKFSLGGLHINGLYNHEKPYKNITKKNQLKKAIIWYILEQNNEGVTIEGLKRELPRTYEFPGNLQPSRQLLTNIVQDPVFMVKGTQLNQHGHYVNIYNIKNRK